MASLSVTCEELRSLAGTSLGTSDWLVVEQSRIDLFADATDDHQWIHVDPVRSAEGPFGATIAHGYLTLSIVPKLLEQMLVVTDKARGTNYGIDRARFTSPVPVGSQVRLSGRIIDVLSRDDGGLQYKLGVEMHIRDHDRPALIAEIIYLAYPAGS